MSAERDTTYKGANRNTILDRPRPDGRRGLVAGAGQGNGQRELVLMSLVCCPPKAAPRSYG
jgi:hypothetical protein